MTPILTEHQLFWAELPSLIYTCTARLGETGSYGRAVSVNYIG
jgi:hypothetical protein